MTSMRRSRLSLVCGALACSVALAGRPPPCAAEPELADLEAFVDGAVASASARYIAGVEVAIVRNGVPILVKGYGLSALAPERPVDGARTLFRIASISKTFTWLALMQLVERGKLRLEDPVNAHLPASLAIPSDGWSKPIRVIDLMNHTAGFEDTDQPALANDDADLKPLATHLRVFRPTRVREPGQISVYSNYGAELAGAVVAHVSDTEFESYVEQHILEPLQMNHTTFREPYEVDVARGLPKPMSKELAADRAAGIEWEAGAWKAFPHVHIQPAAPAGAASSTAADMAKYMSALLDPALLERAGVLSAATHALMMSESFRPAPGVQGIHHGFLTEPFGGHGLVGYANLSHSGFLPHFPSQLRLFPELGLGVFVVANSSSGQALTGPLSEWILRRYFPRQQPTAAKPAAADLSEYAGDYRPLRRSYTKLEAVFSIGQVLPIHATSDGYLVIERPERSVRFARVEGDLFQRVDGDARIKFERNDTGRIVRVVGAMNVTADRVRFFQTLWWLRGWLLASLAAACGVLGGAWFRRRRGAAGVDPLRSKLLTLTAAVWLSFHAAATAWENTHASHDVWKGYPQPVLRLALTLLMAAVALTVVALGGLPWIWRAREWSIGRRLRHTSIALVFAMTAITVNQWNAIGFKWF